MQDEQVGHLQHICNYAIPSSVKLGSPSAKIRCLHPEQRTGLKLRSLRIGPNFQTTIVMIRSTDD